MELLKCFGHSYLLHIYSHVCEMPAFSRQFFGNSFAIFALAVNQSLFFFDRLEIDISYIRTLKVCGKVFVETNDAFVCSRWIRPHL